MRPIDKKPFSTFRTLGTLHDIFDRNDVNITNTILNKRVLLQYSSSSAFGEHHEASKPERKRRSLIVGKKLGRVVLMGDSNCIDSTFTDKYCLWLLKAFLEYTMSSYKSPLLKKLNSILMYSSNDISEKQPRRVKSSRLYKYSKVTKHDNNFEKSNKQICM